MLRPGKLPSLLTRLVADSLRHPLRGSKRLWYFVATRTRWEEAGSSATVAFRFSMSGWHRPSPRSGTGRASPATARRRASLRCHRHYSPHTESAYIGWIRRFILFNQKRHPAELDADAVNRFLTHLATENQVSASTQNQASSALLFLYGEVLGRRLADLVPFHARRPVRLPVVLSRGEVERVLMQLDQPCRLMAALMYGSGLRLMECCMLRIKDVDIERGN